MVTIIGTVFIYLEKYHQTVAFSRVSRVSKVSRARVRIRVSVRFSFIGANL